MEIESHNGWGIQKIQYDIVYNKKRTLTKIKNNPKNDSEKRIII